MILETERDVEVYIEGCLRKYRGNPPEAVEAMRRFYQGTFKVGCDTDAPSPLPWAVKKDA